MNDVEQHKKSMYIDVAAQLRQKIIIDMQVQPAGVILVVYTK